MVPNYIADDEDEIEGETPEERALRLAQAGTPDFAGDQNDAPVASHGQAPPDVAMDQSEGPPAPSLSWTKSVNPSNGKTVVVPSAQDKAISGYEQALGDYPEKKAPSWLQRIAAGAAGGLAGWSNAAGRARPIDIGKMTESIEHPGYESKLEAWRSRVAPAQMQVELEGQRAAAQQKSAETAADIAYKQAHANYMNGVGRAGPSVEVSPEMEETTGGVFKAGMKIPAATATEIARIAAGKYEKPEKTTVVTDPDLARMMGVKPGTAVPNGLYQAAVTSNNKEPRAPNEWQSYLDAAGGDPAKALAMQQDARIRVARESRPAAASAAGSASDEARIADIANGDAPMPPARSKGYQDTYDAVKDYDKTYTEARYKIKQGYKTGKDKDKIQSITRILGHLDSFDQNSNKLGVSSVSIPGLGNMTGDQKALHTDVNAISEEFGRLVANKSLTQSEAERAEANLLSPFPSVRRRAIKEVGNLLGSQFKGIFQSYRTAAKQEFPVDEFFDPETQEQITRRGYFKPGASNLVGSPKAAPGGSPAANGANGAPSHGIPDIGATFNGGKVLKVTKIQ